MNPATNCAIKSGSTNVYSPNIETDRALGPVDNYLSQTIMQAMQIMDMKAWAVLS